MATDPDERPLLVPAGTLTLGQILGGAFRMVGITPLVTVVLPVLAALIEFGVLLVIDLAYGRLTGIPAVDVAAAAALLWVVLGSVPAAATFVVLDHAVRGRRIGAAAALAAGLRRAPGLVVVYLLNLVIVAVVAAVGLIPVLVLEWIGTSSFYRLVGGPVLVLSICAMGIYAWVVHISLIVAGPAYVVEDVGVLGALARSRRLAPGNWWRTFGTLLVAGVVVAVVAAPAAIPALVAGPGQRTYLLGGLWAALITGFAAPFFTGVIGLIHVDQRVPWRSFR
jgi:hypothetical protein